MSANEKIIEIDPEMERRVADRRQSEPTLRAKAIQRDRMVANSRHYFESYVRLSRAALINARDSEQDATRSYYVALAKRR